MSEILTIREDVTGDYTGWSASNSSQYSSNSNKKVAVSNSESLTEPTSIPSPFARMELARTAFAFAADLLRNGGKVWNDVPARYRKIISDCLDVAEIFFNYPQYKDFLKIIIWDPDAKEKLKSPELKSAIDKFGNFNNEQNFNGRFYLLNYIGDNRPDQNGLNIIGATSPITMFFSIGNDLSYVSEKIKFTNGHKPFFCKDKDSFMSLEMRDSEFINYLYGFMNKEGERFKTHFKAFADYLMTLSGTNRLPEGTVRNDSDYPLIEADGNNVEVCGMSFCHRPPMEVSNSDFEIKPKFYKGALPLVLPVERSNIYENCHYINSNYVLGDNIAPKYEAKALNDRFLPGTNIQYPYLTISDFFADTIIKMPYELNKDSYFDGNITFVNRNEKCSYLLPLKPEFFNYFSEDDLKENIRMTSSGPVVNVELDIPIQNHSGNARQKPYVTFKKGYSSTQVGDDGGILELKCGFGVFSNCRTENERVAHYRLALFNREEYDVEINVFNRAERVESFYKERIRREGMLCGVGIYRIKGNFDRVEISAKNVKGYVVPIFRKSQGNKVFRFAVDFGTTNTHIAYTIDNGVSQPFGFTQSQIERLCKSYDPHKDITTAFAHNFFPPSSEFRFPLRSVLAEDHIDYKDLNNTYPFFDGNIPFYYEKQPLPNYLRAYTSEELKWSNDQKRVSLYIRSLAFILHNKVLLEGGDLERTEIRWFYPVSMSTRNITDIEDAWKSAYREFFSDDVDNKLVKMSESIAPYCYIANNDGGKGVIVTIDIGGGTTDVYFSEQSNNENAYQMSFRCASNAIFGDGYNNSISKNGFVRKYKDYIEKEINEDEDLKGTMDEIYRKGCSSELISFFFSLNNESQSVFLNKLYEDSELKYVFLVFYSAVLYHVASAMKAKNLPKPQVVAFTGNGSKTLNVISKDVKTLEEFVRVIFEKVYGDTYSSYQFRLKFEDAPKEVAAKGGLCATQEQVKAEIQPIVLLGEDNERFVDDDDSCSYEEIDDSTKDKVVKNVETFIDFIPKLNESNRFGDKFGLDVLILEDVMKICKADLRDFLNQGIKRAISLQGQDRTQKPIVNESLFFFPIVGMLPNLAQYLVNQDKN